MAWPTISISIDRTELSEGALSVAASSGYEVAPDGFGEAEVVASNVYASSRWVDGPTITASRLDVSSLNLRVRVQGESQSDLFVRIEALRNALTQFKFTLTAAVNGVSRTYECMAASNVTVEPFNSVLTKANMAYVSAVIPRQPQVS